MNPQFADLVYNTKRALSELGNHLPVRERVDAACDVLEERALVLLLAEEREHPRPVFDGWAGLKINC